MKQVMLVDIDDFIVN